MGSTKSVLVVDDDETVLAGCVRSLSREWRVYAAADATTARRIIRAECPDVAIVDLRLGSESGLELLRELKRERPTIKVAVISGYLTIEAAVCAARLGADAVLSKPVRPAEIMRQLQEGPAEPNLDQVLTLARVEYEHIARVMADCNNNISEAARRLGIHRHSLQRKLRRPAPKA
jgi:two-component system, response regulator RegA